VMRREPLWAAKWQVLKLAVWIISYPLVTEERLRIEL